MYVDDRWNWMNELMRNINIDDVAVGQLFLSNWPRRMKKKSEKTQNRKSENQLKLYRFDLECRNQDEVMINKIKWLVTEKRHLAFNTLISTRIQIEIWKKNPIPLAFLIRIFSSFECIEKLHSQISTTVRSQCVCVRACMCAVCVY